MLHRDAVGKFTSARNMTTRVSSVEIEDTGSQLLLLISMDYVETAKKEKVLTRRCAQHGGLFIPTSRNNYICADCKRSWVPEVYAEPRMRTCLAHGGQLYSTGPNNRVCGDCKKGMEF